MSKIRDFFIGLPAACGAKNAEAWGQVNALQFDHEISHPMSVFADNGRPVPERLDTAFGWAGRDPEKNDIESYARHLAILLALSDAVDRKGRIELAEERDALAGVLSTYESRFPTVSALMTVSEASVAPQSGWA